MAHDDLDLNQQRDAAEVALITAAAVETGLFEALADGPRTAAAVAAELGLDGRAVDIVLGALEPAGLTARAAGGFRLTERAHRTLADPLSPEYAAGGLPHWLELMTAFARLSQALREGVPVGERAAGERSPESMARFMAAMASRDRDQVRRTVDLVLERRPGARTVLDLGGGPGVYARAFLDAGVERVTLFDREDALSHVREAYGVGGADGVEAVGGDFLADPLPAGPYDAVLLSNITHIYPASTNAALLAKVHGVVAPGGVVAIGDFVRGRSTRAARFAVVMLVRSGGGDTYDEGTYRGWLEAAGFAAVRIDDVSEATQLVTAMRP